MQWWQESHLFFLSLFLRHCLLYGGSSTEQKTFLGSHSYWETCYQVMCSVLPPPHPTSRTNGWRCPRAICFLNSSNLFSIFQKNKKVKKWLPSTLDTEPSLYIFECNRYCGQLPDDCFVRGMKLKVAKNVFELVRVQKSILYTYIHIYIHV